MFSGSTSSDSAAPGRLSRGRLGDTATNYNYELYQQGQASFSDVTSENFHPTSLSLQCVESGRNCYSSSFTKSGWNGLESFPSTDPRNMCDHHWPPNAACDEPQFKLPFGEWSDNAANNIVDHPTMSQGMSDNPPPQEPQAGHAGFWSPSGQACRNEFDPRLLDLDYEEILFDWRGEVRENSDCRQRVSSSGATDSSCSTAVIFGGHAARSAEASSSQESAGARFGSHLFAEDHNNSSPSAKVSSSNDGHENKSCEIEAFVRSRAEQLRRYREKKARRDHQPKVRYVLRKANADKRPRIKGRFIGKGVAIPAEKAAAK
eukprot:scaffold15717_cov43-Prasinocladus_malaysianus.AAC.2